MRVVGSISDASDTAGLDSFGGDFMAVSSSALATCCIMTAATETSHLHTLASASKQ